MPSDGDSRDTFHHVKDAYETGGIEALRDQSKRKPNRKNRVSALGRGSSIADVVRGAYLGTDQGE